MGRVGVSVVRLFNPLQLRGGGGGGGGEIYIATFTVSDDKRRLSFALRSGGGGGSRDAENTVEGGWCKFECGTAAAIVFVKSALNKKENIGAG